MTKMTKTSEKKDRREREDEKGSGIEMAKQVSHLDTWDL